MASGLRDKTDASIDSLYDAASSYKGSSHDAADLSALARPTTPSTLLQRKSGQTGANGATQSNARRRNVAPVGSGDGERSAPSSASSRPALPAASRSEAAHAASLASTRPALPTSSRSSGCISGSTSSAPTSARSGLHRTRSMASTPSGPALASARAKVNEPDTKTEFQRVTVDISGRSGYNAAALNGEWIFWKVIGDRLAFTREAEVQVEKSAVLGLDENEPQSDTVSNGEGEADTTEVAAKVLLFLFYVPKIDMWLVSDAPGMSGSIAADCGPVGTDIDLGQNWRVWDGETWSEDLNIVVEICIGDPAPTGLKPGGLRVGITPPAGATRRAKSQEGSSRRESRQPNSAR